MVVHVSFSYNRSDDAGGHAYVFGRCCFACIVSCWILGVCFVNMGCVVCVISGHAEHAGVSASANFGPDALYEHSGRQRHKPDVKHAAAAVCSSDIKRT